MLLGGMGVVFVVSVHSHSVLFLVQTPVITPWLETIARQSPLFSLVGALPAGSLTEAHQLFVPPKTPIAVDLAGFQLMRFKMCDVGVVVALLVPSSLA